MGNVNMEAHQIHYKGEETAKTMFEKLDLIAQQVGDLPTFTSDDRAFLEKLPALPTVEGKTVLTAETDDQGETNLSYATPEVEGEDVAPEFSDAEAYSAGDLVFHDGILYRFISDHAAGDWDATEATTTSVSGELSELNEKLDLIAQQVGDLPTFTSDDRVFLEKLPALPTVEGKTVLTAETDDQGETNLSYATPEVEGEDVAPEFSDAEAYSAGDLVFHDGILYRFTSDHSAGDWDATEATPTSVDRELSELKNTLNVLGKPIVITEFGSTTAEQKTIDYTKYRYLLLVLSTTGSGALTIDASLLAVSRFGRFAVRTYINGNSYYGIVVPKATDKIFNCSVSNAGTVCTVYGIK